MNFERISETPVIFHADYTSPVQLIAQAGMGNFTPTDRAYGRERENNHNRQYEELVGMHHKLNEDGSYHYVSMDDLPEVGRGDHPYKITTTGDMYRFRVDRYVPFNPYGLPITDQEAYISTNAKMNLALSEEEIAELRESMEIIDASATMPSGGQGPLAVVWNIHALRGDLWAKGVRDWSYSDMMPPNERWRIRSDTSLQEQRNLYFRYAHKTLWDQVRTHMRSQGEFKKDYVSALERLGVSVWFENGIYGFKDGEFVVTFE